MKPTTKAAMNWVAFSGERCGVPLNVGFGGPVSAGARRSFSACTLSRESPPSTLASTTQKRILDSALASRVTETETSRSISDTWMEKQGVWRSEQEHGSEVHPEHAHVVRAGSLPGPGRGSRWADPR